MSGSVRPEFAPEGWAPLSDPMTVQPGQVVRYFRPAHDDISAWDASGGTVHQVSRQDGPVAWGYVNFGSLQHGEWEVYAPSSPDANGADAPIRPEFGGEGWEPLDDAQMAHPRDEVRCFYFDSVRQIWDASGGIVASVEPNGDLIVGDGYCIGTVDGCDEWEVRRAA